VDRRALEHGTVDVLREVGAAERMDRLGLPHDGFELRFAGHGVRVDMQELTGRDAEKVIASHRQEAAQ